MRASCGLEFASSALPDVIGPVDTLMVAGGADMDAAVADTELLAQVRRLATDARRVTSVCSGAFVLAAAGLLEGRRATTHWAECGLLDDTYTGVTVDPDAIYVHDGNVWTSAGVTAGIDLALALSLKTTDTRPPPRLRDSWSSTCSAPAVRPSSLRSWPDRQPTANPSATSCHGCATTSPTIFPWPRWPGRSTCPNDSSPACSRRRSGSTAADHVEAVRLESACRLLETTNRSIEQVAKTCGFGTPETMNRTFRRRLNTTPGAHRHHFRGDSVP